MASGRIIRVHDPHFELSLKNDPELTTRSCRVVLAARDGDMEDK
jgi:hypothetical protein